MAIEAFQTNEGHSYEEAIAYYIPPPYHFLNDPEKRSDFTTRLQEALAHDPAFAADSDTTIRAGEIITGFSTIVEEMYGQNRDGVVDAANSQIELLSDPINMEIWVKIHGLANSLFLDETD